MKEYVAKTVDLAIEEGLKELGIEKEDAEIEIVEEGGSGFLGLGAKKAIVRVGKKLNATEKAVEFLNGMFELLNVTAKTEIRNEDEKTIFDIVTTQSPMIIGYRGEVLDALQTMVSAIVNNGHEEYVRVAVDCENYRKKREETLIALAEKLAEKAVKLGKKVALEPMNPFERRIIHSALSENSNVRTESNGKEPSRYVVIIPDNWDGDEREVKERPYTSSKGGNRNQRRSGGGRNNKRGGKGGFKSDMIKTTQKTSGFGTFLGNSKNI